MSVTAQKLYDKTTQILDGEAIDVDLFLTLLATAKNSREAEKPWRFLTKEDSSQNSNAGDTFLTMKTLPSDFGYDYRMFVGDSLIEYTPVPFEERRRWKDSAMLYYIDLRNSQFALTGVAGITGTIYLVYIAFTSDPAQLGDNMPTAWPDRFLPILSFDVVALFRGGTDYDDVNARMSAENRAAARALHDGMTSWDSNLKIRAMNYQSRRPRPDISRVANIPNLWP